MLLSPLLPKPLRLNNRIKLARQLTTGSHYVSLTFGEEEFEGTMKLGDSKILNSTDFYQAVEPKPNLAQIPVFKHSRYKSYAVIKKIKQSGTSLLLFFEEWNFNGAKFGNSFTWSATVNKNRNGWCGF